MNKGNENKQQEKKKDLITGFHGMLLGCFVLLFGTIFIDEEQLYLVEPVMAVLWLGIGFAFLGREITEDKKLRLIFGILGLAIGLVQMVRYFARIMG